MKKNLNSVDRIIRVLVALLIAVLAYANVITGLLAIVLLVFAGVFVLTSLFSFCPIYFSVGLSSLRKKKE